MRVVLKTARSPLHNPQDNLTRARSVINADARSGVLAVRRPAYTPNGKGVVRDFRQPLACARISEDGTHVLARTGQDLTIR